MPALFVLFLMVAGVVGSLQSPHHMPVLKSATHSVSALKVALDRGTDSDWSDYCDTVTGPTAPYAAECSDETGGDQ